MIGIDDFVAYVEIAIAHHEGTPTSAGGKPTALNYFILSCRERQFWAGLRSHGKPGSVQCSPGASPLATGCGSRHAPGESSCQRPLSNCPSFSSDSAILDNVRSYGRSALILCSAGVVLIFYGRPEAAKHPHIGFAHLDYNGAV